MPKLIAWNSWSSGEASFELEKFKSLPLINKWVNPHNTNIQLGKDDIWLTTNGYSYKPGNFKKASLYWESYQYLKSEYDNWLNDKKWDNRFHFNSNYTTGNCKEVKIGGWWKDEIKLFNEIIKDKQITHTFGMVLGKKPPKVNSYELGWYRTEIVDTGKDRSFKYYGTAWNKNDKNYGGEAYINGNKHTPIKFNDARILMKNSKFVFAIENIYDSKYSINYLTEKIFHGFLSCSIPIYAGCWNIEQLIDPSLFIDIRKFDFKMRDVMDYCEKMSETEYNGYISRIADFLHGKGQEFTCEERFLTLDKLLSNI